MYEHIALGYRSSLALCLTKVRAVDIQIMSEYDQTFGPKLLIGHCDLFSRFSDFALYLGTQLVYDRVQVGKDQEKAQSEKDSHSKNRGGKNYTNNQVLLRCKHRKPNEQLYFFPFTICWRMTRSLAYK